MSVNMLSERLRSDCQPRSKNGHPPHNTTGVLKMNCTQRDQIALHPSRRDAEEDAPSRATNTGKLSAAPIQKRRVMSRSSAFSSSAPAIGRSSAPAPSRRSGKLPDDPARSPDASGRCRLFSERYGGHRIALQRHSAFRTTAGRVALDAFAHRAEIFFRRRRRRILDFGFQNITASRET